MELLELQKHWDAFGKTDPLWAILSLPEKRFGKWNLAEFFQYGTVEIDELRQYLKGLGCELPTGRALDFGCGVGRLTQALAEHCKECCGVDISPSMIEAADRLNQHGSRCRYVLNGRDDLSIFEDDSFDFIYSIIVLQHMRPEYMKRYLKEFLRVLAPGGLLVFQLPGEPLKLSAYDASTSQTSTDATVQDQALPDSGFKAEVEIIDPPTRMNGSTPTPIRVRVRNQGDATWHPNGLENDQFRIKLGNHWLDEGGVPVPGGFDDARSRLPHAISPGAEVEIELVVTAPSKPGQYLLEIDMVQEYVSWFGHKGSPTARASIHVETGSADFVPTIEMYWILKAEVVSLMEENAGNVIHVQDVSCPNSFQDLKYFVRKAST